MMTRSASELALDLRLERAALDLARVEVRTGICARCEQPGWICRRWPGECASCVAQTRERLNRLLARALREARRVEVNRR
jgi:hypothetical protein